MKSIWVPISGQIAQQQKVETIANNIANANTIGFKKDDLVFKEYLESVENPKLDLDIPRKDFSPDDMYKQEGAQKSYVAPAQSYTDHSQGQLSPTNNPLDLAIQGDAFFEVLTPHGVRYTKNGAFTLNNEGELVTANNFKVLGKSKNATDLNSNEDPTTRIIKIKQSPTQNERIVVNKQGEIFQGNLPKQEISIVQIDQKDLLKKEGSGLFYIDLKLLNSATTLTEAKNYSVEQGFLENSNVNAVQEMSELIKAHRQFDHIQRAVQAYDGMNNKAMNELMKF